jgi:hypothetical protein
VLFDETAAAGSLHGDKAPMACAEMVDRWGRRGDQEAAENWRRIMEAARADRVQLQQKG